MSLPRGTSLPVLCSEEGERPCVRSVTGIPLASHSGCQAASDWGDRRMVFTLTWKSAVDPRNPFSLACLWTRYIPMKALWFLTNPLHLHFLMRKLELIRNFCKSGCPVLYQTLKKGNGKEENGYNLNLFSLLSWSEHTFNEQLAGVWCLTGFASTLGAMLLPDVFAYEKNSVF